VTISRSAGTVAAHQGPGSSPIWEEWAGQRNGGRHRTGKHSFGFGGNAGKKYNPRLGSFDDLDLDDRRENLALTRLALPGRRVVKRLSTPRRWKIASDALLPDEQSVAQQRQHQLHGAFGAP